MVLVGFCLQRHTLAGAQKTWFLVVLVLAFLCLCSLHVYSKAILNFLRSKFASIYWVLCCFCKFCGLACSALEAGCVMCVHIWCFMKKLMSLLDVVPTLFCINACCTLLDCSSCCLLQEQLQLRICCTLLGKLNVSVLLNTFPLRGSIIPCSVQNWIIC